MDDKQLYQKMYSVSFATAKYDLEILEVLIKEVHNLQLKIPMEKARADFVKQKEQEQQRVKRLEELQLQQEKGKGLSR